MSTLVKILFAAVFQLLSNGDLPHQEVTTRTEIIQAKHTLDDLNPQYIVTKEEFLAQYNNTAI